MANYFSKSTTDLSPSYVAAAETVELLPQPPPPIIRAPAGYTLYKIDPKPPSYSVEGPSHLIENPSYLPGKTLPPVAQPHSEDEPRIMIRPKSILKENKVDFEEGLECF